MSRNIPAPVGVLRCHVLSTRHDRAPAGGCVAARARNRQVRRRQSRSAASMMKTGNPCGGVGLHDRQLAGIAAPSSFRERFRRDPAVRAVAARRSERRRRRLLRSRFGSADRLEYRFGVGLQRRGAGRAAARRAGTGISGSVFPKVPPTSRPLSKRDRVPQSLRSSRNVHSNRGRSGLVMSS
jgi:hypothetical protein